MVVHAEIKRSQSQARIEQGGKTGEHAACRRAMESFFNCLERSCGKIGCIDEALALRVWPFLTRHVDGEKVRKLERQLRKRIEPIGREEWLSLMDVICTMGGMRLFMSSVLNTWVLLEEGKLKQDPVERAVCSTSQATLPPLRPRSGTSRAMRDSIPMEATAPDARRAPVKNCWNTGGPQKTPSLQWSHNPAPSSVQHPPVQTVLDFSPSQSSLCPEERAPPCDQPPRDREVVQISPVSSNSKGEAPVLPPESAAHADSSESGVHDVKDKADEPPGTSAEAAAAVEAKPDVVSIAPVLEPVLEPASQLEPEQRCEAAKPAPPTPTAPPDVEHLACQPALRIDDAPLSGAPDVEVDSSLPAVPAASAPPSVAAENSTWLEEESNTGAEPEAAEANPEASTDAEHSSPAEDASPPSTAEAVEIAPLDDVSGKNAVSRSKEPSSKRKSALSAAGMRRSISQPLPTCPRSITLPPLPKVPVAVPNDVKLAQTVDKWKSQHFMHLRHGNIIEAKKNMSSLGVHRGQFGRIINVVYEVSVDVLMEGSSQAICLQKKDFSSFELHVITHEVELITSTGQRSGKYVACMLLKNHEDGFCSILCQDGRRREFVYSSFVKELSSGMFTDVGYLSGRSSHASGRSSGSSKAAGLELPPEGYIGAKAAGKFTAAPALTLARSRSQANHASKNDDEGKDDTCKGTSKSTGEASNIEPGRTICPFMEIQDGGLKAFMSLCDFTVNDTVLDIGCGHGKILNKILESCPCKGIGVEINYSIARHAEDKLRKFASRARVVVDDIRNVDLQNVTVTVSYLLSHSFDANGGALKEHLSKSLRPGSIVLNYTYPVPGWTGSLQSGIHRYVIGEHLPGAGS